jgi:hypothetical protein
MNGVAIAVAIGFIASRIKMQSNGISENVPVNDMQAKIPPNDVDSIITPNVDPQSLKRTPKNVIARNEETKQSIVKQLPRLLHCVRNDETTEVFRSSLKKNERWTLSFSALFVMLGLTYFNAVKNVSEWASKLNPAVWTQTSTDAAGNTETVQAVWDIPFIGRLPGIHFLHLTPTGWFNLTWLLLTIACVYIIYRHFKKPLTLIPASPFAKGQIIYLIVLWVMVIANFERALVNWHPVRLLTEWIIILNAIIATALLITRTPTLVKVMDTVPGESKKLYRRFWLKGIAVFILSSLIFLAANRMIYHYPEYNKLNHKRYQTRFGPEASWKSRPILLDAEHR